MVKHIRSNVNPSMVVCKGASDNRLQAVTFRQDACVTQGWCWYKAQGNKSPAMSLMPSPQNMVVCPRPCRAQSANPLRGDLAQRVACVSPRMALHATAARVHWKHSQSRCLLPGVDTTLADGQVVPLEG